MVYLKLVLVHYYFSNLLLSPQFIFFSRTMDCHHCGQQFTNELAALYNQARAFRTKVIDYLIGRISMHISIGIPIARRS